MFYLRDIGYKAHNKTVVFVKNCEEFAGQSFRGAYDSIVSEKMSKKTTFFFIFL
jgi:hypothetical protein